jgi:hypothetical protein
MNSAHGFIRLPDRPGYVHHRESELSKTFENNFPDKMPFRKRKRPLNKRAPTGIRYFERRRGSADGSR